MSRLAGKVAIITGGASGQGEAEARLFVAEGARIVIADVSEREGRGLADELGEAAVFQPLDVADEAAWTAAVEIAQSRFGRIDVLVNNAGLFRPKPFLKTDNAEWDAHYRVNQLGTFLGMRAVAASLIAAGGGSIVNISSAAGARGIAGMFGYSASKWAIRGMSKAAALDLAAHNVRVNCVLPGMIDTPMYRANGPEACAVMDAMIPLGRRARADEVAELVAFIVSDAGAYLTGAEFTIDGGVIA